MNDKTYIEKDGKIYEVAEVEVNINDKMWELIRSRENLRKAVIRERNVIDLAQGNIDEYQVGIIEIEKKMNKIKIDFPGKIDEAAKTASEIVVNEAIVTP